MGRPLDFEVTELPRRRRLADVAVDVIRIGLAFVITAAIFVALIVGAALFSRLLRST